MVYVGAGRTRTNSEGEYYVFQDSNLNVFDSVECLLGKKLTSNVPRPKPSTRSGYAALSLLLLLVALSIALPILGLETVGRRSLETVTLHT